MEVNHQDAAPAGDRPANIRYPEVQVAELPEHSGYLDTWDIACLIINKMIGTGIFITPASVVVLVGSKYGALLLWSFGSLYSFISILVYLEYGLAWPFTGGEFTYIKKIFPRPALITATSFAWFFVSFSTSTGNALNFAKYISLAGANFMVEDAKPRVIEAWQLKFIACWVVVAICLLHYRLIDIGVWSNFALAGYKVLLVTILVISTWAGLAHEHQNGNIRGAHDWRHFNVKTNHVKQAKGGTAADSPVNTALAMFLVLYSYQGWENANYITADIEGNVREKRRKLKKGALWAVGTFFLLTNDDIQESFDKGYSVAYDMALHSFSSKDPNSWTDSYRTTTRKGIFAAIAISAFGNLVGVIFTNGRVKREIANDSLIPGSNYFSASSTYGRLRDSAGTPTGGLVLHGLATCITITATPLYGDGSTEGLSFIMNSFTYGHSMLGNFDGDIDENAQLSGTPPLPRWEYKILKTRGLRWSCAIFFICVNGFLVILPMVPSNLASGKPRRIPNWELPAVVLPFFVVGAIAGLTITIFATHMEFRTGPNQLDIPYAARRWVIQYPRYGDFCARWTVRRMEGSIWDEAKTRLMLESEASHARQIRNQTWQSYEMHAMNPP
ncbi:amino acid permease-domain-containing protein [Bisporella sp. PMI_857]|nr:amino acid permease-domain-containing protein [Bisporella sp. PMI_857]